ncbi:cobalt-precorrin-5B (C(1))-methyltransferase CbiD [uncultured Desulfovibrio sp.]|uniref:cobalt-precorrin-5B (C(1))-methyltransferase CbiD n=1 Tax=uncultured Desulfovibrio sp. TaxID=167968 RepID=UPI0026338F60|nr:cobalt-precorrin-5B (C(1))-methyltransferase CbiD [uncultured Desulfovibrio sp.]
MARKDRTSLRWGYSTGACAAALAVACWQALRTGRAPAQVDILFGDGRERLLPLRPPAPGRMAEMVKDGGDDPDCTHGAVLFARLAACAPDAARPEDIRLPVGAATLILRAVEGIGLCTRPGLDCLPGRWAVSGGPRRMLAENLRRAGMASGCWLLELGVENGAALARHTLNPRLGVEGGISILGSTGLVRPYSHAAYVETVRLCVQARQRAGGRGMVFCTGGRTRAGARRQLPQWPESAFVCIGDFIAHCLGIAARHQMQEVAVACMAGKLCKYAAGFANTHAHQVEQDMDLLRRQVRACLPGEDALHTSLRRSASVREALLALPAAARLPVLRALARAALEQFARRVPGIPVLRLLVFDFDGRFLFREERLAAPGAADDPAAGSPDATGAQDAPDGTNAPDDPDATDAEALPDIGPRYFIDRP